MRLRRRTVLWLAKFFYEIVNEIAQIGDDEPAGTSHVHLTGLGEEIPFGFNPSASAILAKDKGETA